MVYVVVLFGFTVNEFPVVPPGFQVKVPPGIEALAFMVALCPLQITGLFTVITGVGLTVMTPVAVPGQPPCAVKVTV
jgi:hypothetical protein